MKTTCYIQPAYRKQLQIKFGMNNTPVVYYLLCTSLLDDGHKLSLAVFVTCCIEGVIV